MTGLSPAPSATSELLDGHTLAGAVQSLRLGHLTSDRAGGWSTEGRSGESPRRCQPCQGLHEPWSYLGRRNSRCCSPGGARGVPRAGLEALDLIWSQGWALEGFLLNEGGLEEAGSRQARTGLVRLSGPRREVREK